AVAQGAGAQPRAARREDRRERAARPRARQRLEPRRRRLLPPSLPLGRIPLLLADGDRPLRAARGRGAGRRRETLARGGGHHGGVWPPYGARELRWQGAGPCYLLRAPSRTL